MPRQYSKAEVQRARLVVKLNDSLKRPTPENVRLVANAPSGPGPSTGGQRLATRF